MSDCLQTDPQLDPILGDTALRHPDDVLRAEAQAMAGRLRRDFIKQGQAASAEAVVKYCKEHIDPSRLKGFYTAPWAMTVPDTEKKKGVTKVIEGIDLFAAARDRHYPAG